MAHLRNADARYFKRINSYYSLKRLTLVNLKIILPTSICQGQRAVLHPPHYFRWCQG